MASEVDIANLALGHLADEATVASFDPPEGSIQAQHCAIFYPIARDALLAGHDWSFCTTRTSLAKLADTFEGWQFGYGKPASCLRIFSILPPGVTNDQIVAGLVQPQDFSLELQDNGEEVILTNQDDAVCRYSKRVTDTSKFPPLFVLALSYNLAALLAGPVLKGDAASKESARCLNLFQIWMSKAIEADSSQRQMKVEKTPNWIRDR